MNKISVIMSTYNESLEFLSKSIQSILDQTYTDFEFIIVNDNPLRVDLMQFLEFFSYKDKRIKIINNETNIGLPLSLNKALSLAQGEYIARMDADDVAMPNRLSNQIDYLKRNSLDLIGSSIIKIDESDKVISRESVPNSKFKILKIMRFFSCVNHPTWFGKRQIFEVLKGYRNIKTCEDYDFLLRALKNNFRVGNLKKETLYYRIRSNSITQSNLVKQRLITAYLFKLFSKNQLENSELLDSYLNSEQYQKDYLSLSKYEDKKRNLKMSNSFFKRLMIFISLLNNSLFYKNVYSCFLTKMLSKM